jgi:hypothetical protein
MKIVKATWKEWLCSALLIGTYVFGLITIWSLALSEWMGAVASAILAVIFIVAYYFVNKSNNKTK